jgi:calmodulin
MLVEHRVEKGSQEKELQEMFSVFDRDKNGYIDRSELKSTMSEMGIMLSDVDVQEMLKEAGVRDSRLYFEGEDFNRY